MDFLQTCFYGVFELPLPRNAQKRTKKKAKKKKGRMVGGWVWNLANVRGGPSIFFAGPPSRRLKGRQKKGGENNRRSCFFVFLAVGGRPAGSWEVFYCTTTRARGV
jgi:hypothetical protein